MNGKRYGSIAVALAALVFGLVPAEDASARLRVDATVRVPGVVRIHAPDRHVRVVRPLPPLRHVVRRDVTRHDRRVAHRLADATGIRAGELLHLRRVGYRWSAIGAWLDLPRRTVRAAMRADTWARHRRREARLDRFRVPAHPRPRVRCEIDGRHGGW